MSDKSVKKRQEEARNQTSFLVCAFILGVVATCLSLWFWCALLATFVLGKFDGWHDVAILATRPNFFLSVWGPIFLLIAVFMATAYAYLAWLGPDLMVQIGMRAAPIDETSENPRERLCCRLVQKLAQKAGVAPPNLYVTYKAENQEKEENKQIKVRLKGINACALGEAERAAIVVTDVALKHLSPDELEGILGHEIGHIRNGDSVFGLHLIATVFALNSVYALAAWVALGTRWIVERVAPRKEAGVLPWATLWLLVSPIMLASLGLAAIGFVGSVGAHFLQAAVSREREFLADQAAAELTGKPTALALALRKGFLWFIFEEKKKANCVEPELARMFACEEAISPRSNVAPRYPKLAYLFFAFKPSFVRLPFEFPSHPEVRERIRRLDPRALEMYPFS